MGRLWIRSLASGQARSAARVRLLDHGDVAFEQTTEGLRITLPRVDTVEGPHGFAITQG